MAGRPSNPRVTGRPSTSTLPSHRVGELTYKLASERTVRRDFEKGKTTVRVYESGCSYHGTLKCVTECWGVLDRKLPRAYPLRKDPWRLEYGTSPPGDG